MDSFKLTIGFLGEILYAKGFIGSEELNDIMDIKDASQLDGIIEKMMNGTYSTGKRGESYVSYGK